VVGRAVRSVRIKFLIRIRHDLTCSTAGPPPPRSRVGAGARFSDSRLCARNSSIEFSQKRSSNLPDCHSSISPSPHARLLHASGHLSTLLFKKTSLGNKPALDTRGCKARLSPKLAMRRWMRLPSDCFSHGAGDVRHRLNLHRAPPCALSTAGQRPCRPGRRQPSKARAQSDGGLRRTRSLGDPASYHGMPPK